MSGRRSSADDPSRSTSPSARPLLQSALDQLREECRLYNQAIDSYNTHLDNHRDRRDLHDVPFRAPVIAHDAYDDALAGDRAAVEPLLSRLIDQAHLDSHLRRHPRTYPIHVGAGEHLRMARDGLVGSLEEALVHIRDRD